MTEYSVQCGSLKVTILSEDPYNAAIESVARWSAKESRRREESLRGPLAESVSVEQRDADSFRPERFATFDLLARLQGETPEQAWRQVLGGFDPNRN